VFLCFYSLVAPNSNINLPAIACIAVRWKRSLEWVRIFGCALLHQPTCKGHLVYTHISGVREVQHSF
jgi:hypothetical protein